VRKGMAHPEARENRQGVAPFPNENVRPRFLNRGPERRFPRMNRASPEVNRTPVSRDSREGLA